MNRNPIDAYLDRLMVELRGAAPDVRRVLAEAEEHLRDSAAEGIDAGLSPEEAERRAVERFGPARLVAQRFAADSPVRLSRAVLGQIALSLLMLGGIGFVAIGASGVVAAGMGAAWGKSFVSGDPPGLTYTAARCAYFEEYFPSPTCGRSAAAHHYDEVVSYRLAAGILGLGALGVHRLARRRRREDDDVIVAGALPDGFVPTVGAAVFGLAGAGFLLNGLGQLPAGSSNGAGQWFSAAAVALVVAAWFVRSLLRVIAARSGALAAA